MTDNRTNELLRKLLDERGVKYQAIGKRLTYWNRDGSDNECDDADFVADQQPDDTLIVEGLTPEQAIAATLGSEREKKLEKLVQKALDECWCDEWWYEDARKLGLEANY